MSTVNNSVVGKAREAGTNFWLTLLAIAILVFAANTALSVWRATRLGNASTAVADRARQVRTDVRIEDPSFSPRQAQPSAVPVGCASPFASPKRSGSTSVMVSA